MTDASDFGSNPSSGRGAVSASRTAAHSRRLFHARPSRQTPATSTMPRIVAGPPTKDDMPDVPNRRQREDVNVTLTVQLPDAVMAAVPLLLAALKAMQKQLSTLTTKVNSLMVAQTQHAQDLRDMKAQNEKSRAEHLAALKKLEDAIANAGGTTPEVDTAMAELKQSLQAEDEENPDEPPADPGTPPDPANPASRGRSSRG